MEVVVTCPECEVQAKVLPREDQIVDAVEGQCPHRVNPLNCPTLRKRLSIGRQELIEAITADLKAA